MIRPVWESPSRFRLFGTRSNGEFVVRQVSRDGGERGEVLLIVRAVSENNAASGRQGWRDPWLSPATSPFQCAHMEGVPRAAKPETFGFERALYLFSGNLNSRSASRLTGTI